MIAQFQEEMEKIFATATGLVTSYFLGSNVSTQIIGSFPTHQISNFIIELITKATVAVVSGVLTYLAVHGVKKLLKHN